MFFQRQGGFCDCKILFCVDDFVKRLGLVPADSRSRDGFKGANESGAKQEAKMLVAFRDGIDWQCVEEMEIRFTTETRNGGKK